MSSVCSQTCQLRNKLPLKIRTNTECAAKRGDWWLPKCCKLNLFIFHPCGVRINVEIKVMVSRLSRNHG